MFTLHMEPFVAGAVALAVLALHVAFTAYVFRTATGRWPLQSAPDGESGDDRDRTRAEREPDPEGDPDRGTTAPPADGETISCPTCGASNDPEFRFCRRCVSDLTDGPRPRGGRGSAGLGG